MVGLKSATSSPYRKTALTARQLRNLGETTSLGHKEVPEPHKK